MKFTLSWLKEHLDSDASAEKIAEALTGVGLEVEELSNPAETLKPFVIANVLEARPHPNADRLRLCLVDAGANAPVQVVCGAPNARTGMKGVFAPAGSHIPGTGIALKAGTIRGEASNGMLLSERELGLSEEHEGIVDLPADAPVGVSYAAWAGLDDPVFDIAVTPNRPDALGVYGVARDLAAKLEMDRSSRRGNSGRRRRDRECSRDRRSGAPLRSGSRTHRRRSPLRSA